MLSIAGYIIDRIANITEQPDGVTIQLESGQDCTIRNHVPTRDLLVSWANLSLAFGTPMALFVVAGEVCGAAGYSYLVVDSLSLQDDDTLNVWGGQYSYSLKSPHAENHRTLLLHSQETNRPLFLIMHGSTIESVAELTPQQYEAIAALGGIPSSTARVTQSAGGVCEIS